MDRPRRHTLVDVAIAGLAIASALTLKLFYSGAGADDLRWILGPTTALVELGSSARFGYESGEGYLSRELALLIAPSCAGVNFLVAALCAGAIGLTPLAVTLRAKVAVAMGWLIAAYLLTVFANAFRLLVAVWAEGWPTVGPSLDPDTVHRVQGTAVYFTALCLAYLAARATLSRTPPTRS